MSWAAAVPVSAKLRTKAKIRIFIVSPFSKQNYALVCPVARSSDMSLIVSSVGFLRFRLLVGKWCFQGGQKCFKSICAV